MSDVTMPFTETKPNAENYNDPAAYYEALRLWQGRKTRYETLKERAKESIIAHKDAESELGYA